MGVDAERLEAVRTAPVFGDLDAAQAVVIAALLRPFSAREGATLVRAGAPVERLLLLPDGRTLGEPALNSPATHTATATAREVLRGYELEIGDFDALRAAHDPIAFAVLRRLSRILADRIRTAGGTVATARGGTPGEPTLGAPAVEELPLLRGLPCFAEFGEQ